jgi:hypothetical protein
VYIGPLPSNGCPIVDSVTSGSVYRAAAYQLPYASQYLLLCVFIYLFIYLKLLTPTHTYSVNEKKGVSYYECIVNDVEGSGRDLYRDCITAFAWQDWEKSQETQTETAVLRIEIQSTNLPNAKHGRSLSL